MEAHREAGRPPHGREVRGGELAMTAIEPSAATAIRIRPSVDIEAELPEMWAVGDAARRVDGEIDRYTLDGFRAFYHHLEHCDLTRDLVLAWRGSELVGYGRVSWADSTDGERWYESACPAAPRAVRAGVGS